MSFIGGTHGVIFSSIASLARDCFLAEIDQRIHFCRDPGKKHIFNFPLLSQKRSHDYILECVLKRELDVNVFRIAS